MMAYNYFPQNYQMPAYYPQTQQSVPQQVQVQQQTQQYNSKIYVQGDAGAKSYLVAPGNTVILWDSEAPIFYEKSADYSGVPHIRRAIYKYEDVTPQAKPTLAESDFAKQSDVDYLKSEIEALRAKFGEIEGSKKK